MNSKYLSKCIWFIGILGLSVLAGVLIHYRSNFSGDISNAHATWAQFGDYIGGFVGTILMFLSLLALLLTISSQLREMKEAREQMELMRRSQEKSTKLLELNSLVELQERYTRFMNSWGEKLMNGDFRGGGIAQAEQRVADLDGKIRELEARIEKIYDEEFNENT